MVFNYMQQVVELEFSKSIWRAPYMHDKEKEGYYTQLLKRSRRNLTPRIEDYKGLRENPHIGTSLHKKVFGVHLETSKSRVCIQQTQTQDF
jgi:hypothetical protein